MSSLDSEDYQSRILVFAKWHKSQEQELQMPKRQFHVDPTLNFGFVYSQKKEHRPQNSVSF